MRTDLELWLIVEENFDKYFSSGLCGVICCLLFKEAITKQEVSILMKPIKEYRVKIKETGLYLWNEGSKRPRKMFIQKQILKALKN